MYEKMKMSSFLDLTFDSPDIENLHHTRKIDINARIFSPQVIEIS
jgi:hypothetical protein